MPYPQQKSAIESKLNLVLEARPKRWSSWNFVVYDGETATAEIDQSWWREKGTLTVDGIRHLVYREGVMSGAFLLERDGEVLARAEKPSAMSRRIDLRAGDLALTLQPRHAGGRSFQLLESDRIVGILTPEGAFSRHMRIDFWIELPRAVTVFVVWLTLILWRRDANAAGG